MTNKDQDRSEESPPSEPSPLEPTLAIPTQPGPAAPAPTASVFPATPDSGTAARSMPTWIAGYRTIRKLGEGGMGVVFEAEQQEPKRLVALKVIRGGPFVDEHSVRLFQREAQSLARLKHAGIAAIYEAGRTEDGQSFFAMELVQGTPLDQYLRAHPIEEPDLRGGLRSRLEIFLKICEAINYAHQRGVIHRDLKPSNIMVVSGPGTGRGSITRREEPQVKILDFGLARITDSEAGPATVLTQTGQIQGSLPWMSPEQALGDSDEIDLRTDVYALGVILYEMLTDQPPYETRGLMLPEAVRVIREEPPRRPGTVRRILQGDLETIALKALEKEPARRYQSALAVADDVERYLTDQPILAQAPSITYQLRKLILRHKTVFGSAAVIFILLAAFGITMSVMFEQQRRERMRADAERQKAEQINLFLQEMLGSVDPKKALGREVTVREVLDEAARNVETGLADQPEVAAGARSTIGMTYLGLGLYDKAEPHLRSALASRERLLGSDDPELAGSLCDMATLLWRKGSYAAAESLFRKALAIQRSQFGERNAEVATTLGNLGLLLRDRGSYAAAESLTRQSLELRRSLFPGTNLDVADGLNTMASILQSRGEPAAAEPYSREALVMRRQLLGSPHPDVAENLNNLAVILEAQGRYAQAESLTRESLTMARAMLGLDHPYVASTLNNLATVLTYEGKYAEAESLSWQALRIYRKQLGEEHPAVASALNNLAGLLQSEGKNAEAEPLYRQTLALRRELLGEEHPAVATSLNNLALVCQGQGKLVEAERLYREALAMRRKLLGKDHPQVANSLLGLGQVLLAKRDASAAEPLLRECVAIRSKKRSPENWQLAAAENALGGCLAMERHYAEAESLLLQSTPIITASTAASLQVKRDALQRVIDMYEAQKQPNRAVTFREQLEQLALQQALH